MFFASCRTELNPPHSKGAYFTMPSYSSTYSTVPYSTCSSGEWHRRWVRAVAQRVIPLYWQLAGGCSPRRPHSKLQTF